MEEKRQPIELSEEQLDKVTGGAGLSWKQVINNNEVEFEIKPGMQFTTDLEDGTFEVLIVGTSGLIYKNSAGQTRSHPLSDIKPVFTNVDANGNIISK